MSGSRRWGVLSYSTENLGDDIQSVAARRFLPGSIQFINRERLASAPPASIILNGWYCHDGTRCWPPSDALSPLLTSIHIAPHARLHFARPESLAYLRRHGPVGARDLPTLHFLQEFGVPSSLSRCLTLTFPRNDGPRESVIRLIDVPAGIVLPRRLEPWVIRTTHVLPQHLRNDPAARYRRAEATVSSYRTARLVITTRLHCALPCAAFGTPVVLLLRDGRTSGLEDCLTIWSVEQARNGEWPFDLENPPSPPDVSVEARELAVRCRQFVASQKAHP